MYFLLKSVEIFVLLWYYINIKELFLFFAGDPNERIIL